YVTTTTTYETMISLGFGPGPDGPDDDALTLDDATALAAALARAVTAARDTRPRPPQDGDAPA
nr:hypothetical protein [Micromonospora sp. DSM 115978]